MNHQKEVKKSSRQLNEEYLDAEAGVQRLNKARNTIDIAYLDFQKFAKQEREIWERLATLSKGTEAERSVYQELDSLDEEQQMFNRVLSNGEEELDQTITDKTAQRNQLEEATVQARKEETECQKSTTKN
ncbi:hypothetical protein ACWOFR_04305 [Carnobacterium gallinarum]|uniref:hypothetical protein n=1 Tax=Carnobacterium gallinarum TaxID=2749 RepID=UPI0005504630|nr:hypothetical protein [Carnobacterium gallinarum]